ncbi:hypothetical protein [Sphingobacterium chungjuense]|uniref:hypothetical protein n=1 Tax=Sphingobacterium chungjuense TaxID=2675553 RepID=UPI0014098331|nr:hypothetical protein [Sphingobacterium chungjuense]
MKTMNLNSFSHQEMLSDDDMRMITGGKVDMTCSCNDGSGTWQDDESETVGELVDNIDYYCGSAGGSCWAN